MNEQTQLAAHETSLVGVWQMKCDKVVADSTCARVEWLVSNHLVQLAVDSSGWDELYRDPGDGRLWELTWPQSATHGGGPPRLICIAAEAARGKYGAVVDS